MKKPTIILLLLAIFGCSKEDLPQKKDGLLVDYTGLDGCGWVIESGGEVFEPNNLAEHDIPLRDSLKVNFTYKLEPRGSICMIGPTIKLISIKKK